MKNMQRLFLVLFAGLACIVMFGLLLLYVNYISSRALPTFPRVTINTTVPEAAGVVNQPVIVFGEASDPDGIASAELWVNGTRVASQANPDQNLYPFVISQSWIPDGPGNYLFLLRGIDRKGFASESAPVMIQIGERTYQPDPLLHGQYFVKQGDTIDSIATRFGTTPEEIRVINPGMGDPLPAESISVPPPPETASGEDALPAAGGSDEPPHVSPPAAHSPVDGTPAVPVSVPWLRSLPLPGGFSCILTPAVCAPPTSPGATEDTPVLPASDIHASLVDACQVSVNWTDNSTNEVGFRVYRLVTRPRFRFELLALLDPFPDSGGRLNYVDTSAPAGQFYYAVATINLRGEAVWSAPSERITSTCPTTTVSGGSALDVEALQMTINDSSIERLYCYLSLAGSPFERIPDGTREFITMEGGAWNIAAYASGDNKRTLMMDGTRPLELIAECLGWQGTTLVYLGRFTRSHPREEWDGRSLIAGPDDGAFSVTYRIQPTTPDGTSSGYGGGGGDLSVPVPFNVRATDTWTSCTPFPLGLGSFCPIYNENGLAWDYAIDPGDPRPPLYFKVYKVAEGARGSSLYYTTLDGTHLSAPRGDCGEHASYSISAVVGVDPVSGLEIQSSVSESLDIRPTCGQLEVTLDTLHVSTVEDGDPCFHSGTCGDYEAYGWFWFNGTPIRMFNHCDSGICGGGSSSAYFVFNYEFHPNIVIQVPIRDGEPLYWSFELTDHDNHSPDDYMCGVRRIEPLLPARSLAEWLSIDQDVVYLDNVHLTSGGFPLCTITLHVRGVPGTP